MAARELYVRVTFTWRPKCIMGFRMERWFGVLLGFDVRLRPARDACRTPLLTQLMRQTS